MPLLAVLDESAHGALDESLKTLYVQNSETKQFYLDIAPDEAGKLAFNLQRELDNKKNALTKVHEEKKALAEKVGSYEALGKSPEEIKTLFESNRPEEVTKLIEKYEAEKEQLKKSFDEPLQAANEKVKKLQSQVEESMRSSAITKLRQDHNLNEMADFVLRDHIKVVENEDGSFAVQVIENGQPAMKAGQPMKPEDLIATWREAKKFEPMFNAGTGGGTGSSERSIFGGNGKNFTVSREASKQNPSLYENAKAEAEKVGGTVVFTD